MNKKLTLGARGFVLGSAITDDGDTMRVSKKGLGRGSRLVARVPINLESISDRTPDTVPQPPPSRVLPRPTFRLCVSRDSNLSIMAHFLLWLSYLFLFVQLVFSHLIEIPASKKECFFEDLHVNDQVRNVALPRLSNSTHLLLFQMTVTYQVGGGGHLDIDFWVK